jgi:hypothetical protein
MDRQDLFNDLEFQDQYIVDQKSSRRGSSRTCPFYSIGTSSSRRTGIDLTFPQETFAVNALD